MYLSAQPCLATVVSFILLPILVSALEKSLNSNEIILSNVIETTILSGEKGSSTIVQTFSPTVYSRFTDLQSTIHTATIITVTYEVVSTYSYEIGPSGVGWAIPNPSTNDLLLPQPSKSPGDQNSPENFPSSFNSTQSSNFTRSITSSNLSNSSPTETPSSTNSSQSSISGGSSTIVVNFNNTGVHGGYSSPKDTSTASDPISSSNGTRSFLGLNRTDSSGASLTSTSSIGGNIPSRNSSGTLILSSSSGPAEGSVTVSTDSLVSTTSPQGLSSETQTENTKDASGTSKTSDIVTSTMTTIPAGFSTGDLPGTTYTGNGWITTTDHNHHSTVIPFIVIAGGRGTPLWNLPSIPHIEFSFPGLPRIHLPCVKFLGMKFGDCPSPPVIDGPPPGTDGSQGGGGGDNPDPENDPTNDPTDSKPSSTATSSQSSSSSSCTVTYTASSCVARCVSQVTSGSSCASYSTTCSQNTRACSFEGTTSTVSSEEACLISPPTAMALATQTMCNGGCTPLTTPGSAYPSVPTEVTEPDPNIEKRYIAGRVTADPVRKRAPAADVTQLGGCAITTKIGLPFTMPGWPAPNEIYQADLKNNIDPKLAGIIRYDRATKKDCVFTTTRLSAEEWKDAPRDYIAFDKTSDKPNKKNNKDLSMDHAYEKGWIPQFFNSVVSSTRKEGFLTCKQAHQYFFPSSPDEKNPSFCSIYLLQPVWNALATENNPDFIIMSQFLNGDGKGRFFAKKKNEDPFAWTHHYVDVKSWHIPKSGVDWQWEPLRRKANPQNLWSAADEMAYLITHFEKNIYGVLELKSDGMFDMMQKTNNRIYSQLKFANDFLQSNPGKMFGDLTAYNKVFPNGIHSSYRAFMANIVQGQINAAPQYLTRLLEELLLPNMDMAMLLPDVGKDRKDPNKRGPYWQDWLAYYNAIKANQKYYRTDEGYSWDFTFFFDWKVDQNQKREVEKLFKTRGKRDEKACAMLSQSYESSLSSHSAAQPNGVGLPKTTFANSTLSAANKTTSYTAPSKTASTTSMHGIHNITSSASRSKAASSSTSSPTTTFTNRCYPFSDPDAGKNLPLCQCDGMDGKYLQNKNNGKSDFQGCVFTAPPSPSPTAVPPFTATLPNGKVLSCASSEYYNAAVNKIPTCAGSSQVISTVASLASAFSSSESVSIASVKSVESVSSASVASYSSAAAVPSAICHIIEDDGWGDSAFAVFGINDWAGPDGDALASQEDGCGIMSGWEWHTDDQEEFQGKLRTTQCAIFGLSFFKGGCVERAVKSAGGPDIKCIHPSESDPQPGPKDGSGGGDGNMLKMAKNRVMKSQVTTIKALAAAPEGNATNHDSNPVLQMAVNKKLKSTPSDGNSSQPEPDLPSLTDLMASAAAALPHLMAVATSFGAMATGSG